MPPFGPQRLSPTAALHALSPCSTFPGFPLPHLPHPVSVFLDSPRTSPSLVGIRNWMFVFPPNLRAGALTSKVTAFGGGALGRWVRLDELMGVGPQDGSSVFIRRGRDQRCLSSAREGGDSVTVCQEESPRQDPATLAPSSWTSSLWNCGVPCVSFKHSWL